MLGDGDLGFLSGGDVGEFFALGSRVGSWCLSGWLLPSWLASWSKDLIFWAILSSWSMAFCSNGFQAISSILGGQLGTCGREGGLLVTLVPSDMEELSLELELDPSSIAAKTIGQWSVDKKDYIYNVCIFRYGSSIDINGSSIGSLGSSIYFF